MERQIQTIDATNKVLGRLATQIAVLLRGNTSPTFYHIKIWETVLL